MTGIVLSACFAVAPVHADVHGRPPAATQHPHAPKVTPPPTPRLNPIAAKISAKPQLDARITTLLPKDMTLNQASQGFKNQGQFIAALHVSRNLGCDCFKQLQTDMTQKNMSLGQAIQDVNKTANATTEAHRGETEADADLKAATTSTSTNPTKKKATHGGDR